MIDTPNRVAELRDTRGWTQRQLADLAGVTSQTISNLERGERQPSLETAVAVARAFGLPVEVVFLAGSSTASVEVPLADEGAAAAVSEARDQLTVRDATAPIATAGNRPGISEVASR